jgi:hypothetical protein
MQPAQLILPLDPAPAPPATPSPTVSLPESQVAVAVALLGTVIAKAVTQVAGDE